MDCRSPSTSVHGFFRKFPNPGHLPNSEIKTKSLISPALAGGSLPLVAPGNGEGNGNTLQYSCLENPMDGGAWWAAVHRVAQSWTRLKQLNMLACIGEINGNPLQYSCLENPRDRVAWWTVVCGVAQSQTWLKQLSSRAAACGILVPRPGAKPASPPLEGDS